ncbi:hypothetical protein BJY21_001892 [Kineosphaera limosa]|uniref:Uncharacterized protein n=1 Tax=Kineosphaera limosa NBRC 100340 TaxID=1184609 RepID=K6WXK9_9MICO|nr:hypothetical protein [Kineosphaera limosa]GAB96797.1 hypothetical protein KILIM_049_00150 [Kineosphaera limosa NBRC 100340]
MPESQLIDCVELPDSLLTMTAAEPVKEKLLPALDAEVKFDGPCAGGGQDSATRVTPPVRPTHSQQQDGRIEKECA